MGRFWIEKHWAVRTTFRLWEAVHETQGRLQFAYLKLQVLEYGMRFRNSTTSLYYSVLGGCKVTAVPETGRLGRRAPSKGRYES